MLFFGFLALKNSNPVKISGAEGDFFFIASEASLLQSRYVKSNIATATNRRGSPKKPACFLTELGVQTHTHTHTFGVKTVPEGVFGP